MKIGNGLRVTQWHIWGYASAGGTVGGGGGGGGGIAASVTYVASM